MTSLCNFLYFLYYAIDYTYYFTNVLSFITLYHNTLLTLQACELGPDDVATTIRLFDCTTVRLYDTPLLYYTILLY